MNYSTDVANVSSTSWIIPAIIGVVLLILLVVAEWKIFTKAGEKGWKSLIPIYNYYILCKIADGNGWKFLLFIVPIVNLVYIIMLNYRLALSFGKDVGFTIGLVFLPSIFTLILGFGSAQYIGPRGQQ